MKHFYLAHYDANGNPLGKNWKKHINAPKENANTPIIDVEMKSAEGTIEEIEALADFSRWPPQINHK